VGILHGVIHGVFAQHGARATVVDLTHGVAPQDIHEGAFWLSHAVSVFPQGTVFVAVVDPGVGTARAALAFEAEGRLFVGPDNGLFTGLFEEPREVRRLDLPALGIRPESHTFHGRDVFAPVAARLACGSLRLEDIGPRADTVVRLEDWQPADSGSACEGRVVSVDQFGNLISNLPGAVVARAELGLQRVEVGGASVAFRRTYGEAGRGELVALVSSFGTLEVAVREGNAAQVLGVSRGACVSWRAAG
jgi:S-adenosylmethionine hydrolase